MSETEITFNPDPQILHVLTYLEMRPIDSLCELVDNSIDSFRGTNSNGLILIDLPSRKETEEGSAVIRIRDNGPGMTLAQIQNALRAGYTSKSRYQDLGLFGVGFNIATGKLGRKTRIRTARTEDATAIEVTVDLVAVKRSGEFKVKAVMVEKPDGFQHGTIVEVSEPWPENNQNFGFMQKLVSLGRPKTLAQLGRIYATLIKEKMVRIRVGDDTVEPYNYCVWGDSRFVEHAKHGKIPAVFRFENQVIHTGRHCAECGSVLPDGAIRCSDVTCGATSFVTREEKISGWVGVQRFLDASHFGIDLIRNGRAIRTLEKQAFFEFQDPDTGEPIVDYPIDDRQGRIVGEIHLNHVPVDPAKQNFERSSPEWKRAIEFLRGSSSLQPTKPGAEHNFSPIFKLYQGYRKVRTPGRRSMTMGKWIPGSAEPTSLSKAEIDRLKERFDLREPGYFDDAEWWRLVEQADRKPVRGLKQCPSCMLESPEDCEECPGCGYIFEGKACLNKDCGQTIAKSAISCPHCGTNQVPEIREPWKCQACDDVNASDDAVCANCGQPRGSADPLSRDSLNAVGHEAERLSVKGLSVSLANGEQTAPVDLHTFFVDAPLVSHRAAREKDRLPLVRFAEHDIALFVDPSHPLFESGGVRIEIAAAIEVASYLHALYQSVASKFPREHTVIKISTDLISKYWGENFAPREDAVESEIEDLIAAIRERLAATIQSESLETYNNLSPADKTSLASELMRNGRDISEIRELSENGRFVLFLGIGSLIEIFKQNPKLFFDGRVWSTTFSKIPEFDSEGGETLQAQLRAKYTNFLEAIRLFSENGANNRNEAELALAAVRILRSTLSG